MSGVRKATRTMADLRLFLNSLPAVDTRADLHGRLALALEATVAHHRRQEEGSRRRATEATRSATSTAGPGAVALARTEEGHMEGTTVSASFVEDTQSGSRLT